MWLIVVTTCTDRKRHAVPLELDASSLPCGSQTSVAGEWRKRLSTASAVGVATDVYCGRSFQEAVSAARAGSADFRIISGGLGLVRGDEPIPTYSLSLVRRSREFVGSRVLGSPFSAPRWWREIQKTNDAPLATLIRANRS